MFPNGVLTGEILSAIVAAVLVVAAAWWRVEGVIKEAKREAMNVAAAAEGKAALALAKLAEYQTHVAEHYASKSGMRDLGDRVMAGQDRVLDEITRLHERMDRIIEGRADAKQPPRGGQQ